MWGEWEHMKQGYEDKVNDPWDWVTHFENAVARYTGAKHAIACDSNTNAIRLLLHYFGFNKETDTIEIPDRTYVSVANQIILAGCTPVFTEKRWHRHYKLGGTPITDAAVSFYEGMFTKIKTQPTPGFVDGNVAVLSFHHRKILNIGTGGMILTDSDNLNEWLRPMIYDGRSKYTVYDNDIFKCVGWHMYMTPEQAKRGLEILHSDRIDSKNEKLEQNFTNYKKLSNQPIFRKYQSNPIDVTFNYNNDVILNWLSIINTTRTLEDFIFNLEYLNSDEFKSYSKSTNGFPLPEFESTFNDLDIHSFPESVNFLLFDHIECYSSYDTNPIILWLYSFFKKMGLSHRFKIYGNNLDYESKFLNYEPLPFFVGDSSWLSEKIDTDRKLKKHFICAQGFPKLHRIKLQNFLYYNDLLKNCYWSWNPNNSNIPYPVISKHPHLKECKGLSDVEFAGNQNSLDVDTMHTTPSEFYKSFCGIVSESYFFRQSYDYFNPDGKPTFITEKTEKCFTAGIPFLVFGTPGFLKKLKELGFKTFDKWWDESYDEIEDDVKRFDAITDIITEISNWSLDKCSKIYIEMIDILRHNQKLNIEKNIELKKIKRTREHYLRSVRNDVVPNMEPKTLL